MTAGESARKGEGGPNGEEKTRDSGFSSEPSKAMIAAATRFKEAWEAGHERSADGHVLSDREIVEMHEAALALIWATGTTSLQDALDVLHDFDS